MNEKAMNESSNNETLLKGLRYFTRETRILSAASLACGVGNRLETALDGEDVSERSVFDLASVTKLFTGLCAMKLKEEGLLDFGRPVSCYDSRFAGLSGVTVKQLMAFAVSLQTEGRLDECPDRETAEKALFHVRCEGLSGRRAYSDIPAMVLKYVLEAAGGAPLAELVRRLILLPADMTETWAKVPEERRADCQRYSGEFRIQEGKMVFREGPEPGIPHDPKATLMQGDSGNLCGHAGLFSTRGDLIRFCRAVLAGRIVGEASLREMAVNRTGRRMPDGGWSQFLGYQCYLRHPDQYYSEIPVYMGPGAFGIGGFTGNHLSLDPERGIFVVFLGNRVRDRLTVLIPEKGKTLTDYGLLENGQGRIRRPDGKEVPSSVQYVHQKDAHLHAAVAEALSLPEVEFVPQPAGVSF